MVNWSGTSAKTSITQLIRRISDDYIKFHFEYLLRFFGVDKLISMGFKFPSPIIDLLIVIYLALVFAAFIQYRRLLLAAHDIAYTNYGIAVIEALILGKVIMIGLSSALAAALKTSP